MTYSVKEISDIIRIASKNNVKSLQIGEFSVTFTSKETPDSQKALEKGFPVPSDQKEVIKDLEVARLMIEDPLAYEDHMIEVERTRNSLGEN